MLLFTLGFDEEIQPKLVLVRFIYNLAMVRTTLYGCID